MRALPLLLLVLLAAPGVQARQSDIHRCVDTHGHPVFTDRSCAAMQATPAPAASQAATDSGPSVPLPILCPATAAALRQQVVDAFAAHDPNRLAGLMMWNGYHQRAAVAGMQALQTLMQQPLLDISLNDPPWRDAQATPAAPAAAETRRPPAEPQDDALDAGHGQPRWLTVETTAGDASGTDTLHRFQVVQAAGCLWLQPTD